MLDKMVCVVVYRHPYSVAESVMSHHNWPVYAELWERYVNNTWLQCEG